MPPLTVLLDVAVKRGEADAVVVAGHVVEAAPPRVQQLSA